MNNKKGFTLVELIVSFALITAVSLAFFKTILVLQQEQIKNIAINSYKAFTVVLNNSIQKDFLNDNIEKIISCGENCYDITYTRNGITRLSIDKENNTITYGNIKEKLPKDYKFINNIEFTSYINSYEGNDSYVALNINIKSNYEKDIENIKYVYQYDSDNGIIELDVDGAEASDIIEYLLYTSPLENGLYEPLLPDGTSTGIRYRGISPNNYVYFNCEPKDSSNIDYGQDNYDYANACETWRIIGVFDVAKTIGGATEKRIKIVRDAFTDADGNVLNMSWDSSASNVNSGSGINEWSQADLKNMLNGYYIGEGASCTYCNGYNQDVCENDCTNTINVLSTTSKNMLDESIWNTGAITWNPELIYELSSVYVQERGSTTGKVCSSTNSDGSANVKCNDDIGRTTKWIGKIGLIYPSDYGYASSNELCHSNIYGSSSTCEYDNWLHPSPETGDYFTITSLFDKIDASIVWLLKNDNNFFTTHAHFNRSIRPSLYLKSNVTFIGEGNGTEDSPYILGINE